MRFWKKIVCTLIAVIASSFCAAPLRAQQEEEEKPKPAARVLLPLPDLGGNQQDADQDAQTLQPHRGPIVGVQSPTLGTSELRHSYWVPGIQYGNVAQSNSFGTTNNPGWTSTSYTSGNLSLLEAWGRSLLGANYSGGGFFSSDSHQGRGQYHQLASALEIDQRRWQALFMEQFSYLPQSTYGFGGNTGLSVPGITGNLAVPIPGLQEVFVPGQAILAATGSRRSNATAAQLTYSVSRRGSFTVAGVHGLLRFSNAGNTNNDTDAFSVGYNYAITRKDYLGVVYRFTAFHFPGDPQALGDHVAQLMYGRRITGRLALNLGGGPDVTNFRVPLNGTKQSLAGAGVGSLSYAFHVTNVRLSYTHGVGSGSGLLSGSSMDQVTANLSRPLFRFWVSSWSFGYSRNSQLVVVKSLASPSYNSWLAAAGLSRPLGSNTNFSIGYQAQIQASNGILCATPGCQTNQTTHQIQMSFQWHMAPQVLR